MNRVVRSLKIEFSETKRSIENRLQTLLFVEDELCSFIGDQERFVKMVIEITKNIYDHASSCGTLNFILEEEVCVFEIFDCGIKSKPVNVIENKGGGCTLISAYAESLNISFDMTQLGKYRYFGSCKLLKPKLFEKSA